MVTLRFLICIYTVASLISTHQLRKYYPAIFDQLKYKQFEVMHECVKENLRRGIDLSLYRNTINIEFISRIYFNSILALKNKDLFPEKIFSIKELMENFLEYHLRGICTPKGLEIINQNQIK